MRVWFNVKEFIIGPKLILDTFSHVWFHVEKEFIIDYRLKQLLGTFALDPNFILNFTPNLIL